MPSPLTTANAGSQAWADMTADNLCSDSSVSRLMGFLGFRGIHCKSVLKKGFRCCRMQTLQKVGKGKRHQPNPDQVGYTWHFGHMTRIHGRQVVAGAGACPTCSSP